MKKFKYIGNFLLVALTLVTSISFSEGYVARSNAKPTRPVQHHHTTPNSHKAPDLDINKLKTQNQSNTSNMNKKKSEKSLRALSVFMHIVKTGGTSFEAFLESIHGQRWCSLRPKHTGSLDYAEFFGTHSKEWLDRCDVISGEIDWSFIKVLHESTKRPLIISTLVRKPFDRVVSWYHMRLEGPEGVPCIKPNEPEETVTDLSRVLETITNQTKDQTEACLSSMQCCVDTQGVYRKCLEGGMCGQGRNLMTMVLAGVDKTDVYPFHKHLLNFSNESQKVLHAALQLDEEEGKKMLFQAKENLAQFSLVGFTHDFDSLTCRYLSMVLQDNRFVFDTRTLRKLQEKLSLAPRCFRGKSRGVKKFYHKPLELEDQINAANALDVELYDWILEKYAPVPLSTSSLLIPINVSTPNTNLSSF